MRKYFSSLLVFGLATIVLANGDIRRNGTTYTLWDYKQTFESTDSTITAEAAAKTLEAGCARQEKTKRWISHLGFIINYSNEKRNVFLDRENLRFYSNGNWEEIDNDRRLNTYFIVAIFLAIFAIISVAQEDKARKNRTKNWPMALFFSATSLLLSYEFWPNSYFAPIISAFIGAICGVLTSMLLKKNPEIKEILIRTGKLIVFWGLLLVPTILFSSTSNLWFLILLLVATFFLTILLSSLIKEAEKRIAAQKTKGRDNRRYQQRTDNENEDIDQAQRMPEA